MKNYIIEMSGKDIPLTDPLKVVYLSPGFPVIEGETIDVYETTGKVLGFTEHEIPIGGHYLCQDDKIGRNVYLQPFRSKNMVNGACCFPVEVKKVGRLIIKKLK